MKNSLRTIESQRSFVYGVLLKWVEGAEYFSSVWRLKKLLSRGQEVGPNAGNLCRNARLSFN
jgi:hypothetical protein